MFIFKKIFSQFFFPVPLVIYFFITGLLLLWFTKRHRGGKILLSIGVLIFILPAYGVGSNALLRHLERRYDPNSLHKQLKDFISNENIQTKLVVVLGGGLTYDHEVPITSQINYYSLVRLIEGIRIYRKIPGCKLLLSGGRGLGDTIPDALIMANVAKEIGIDGNDIIVETNSRDTEDQANIIKPIVNNDPFILVTSASHMPRSMALFKRLGMNPIPAPTGHQVKSGQGLSLGSFFPGAAGIVKLEGAFYEYIGIAWLRLSGEI